MWVSYYHHPPSVSLFLNQTLFYRLWINKVLVHLDIHIFLTIPSFITYNSHTFTVILYFSYGCFALLVLCFFWSPHNYSWTNNFLFLLSHIPDMHLSTHSLSIFMNSSHVFSVPFTIRLLDQTFTTKSFLKVVSPKLSLTIITFLFSNSPNFHSNSNMITCINNDSQLFNIRLFNCGYLSLPSVLQLISIQSFLFMG